MLWRGGVKRRLGYAREGRSLLLTDRVYPIRKNAQEKRRDQEKWNAMRLLRQEEPIADGDLLRVEIVGNTLGRRTYVEHRMRSTGRIVRSPMPAIYGNFRETAPTNVFQPVPAIDYYLELLRYLRGDNALFNPEEKQMVLGITNEERAEAQEVLNVAPGEFVVMVPGANFGSSKCWLPDRFASVAATLADPAGPYNAQIILAGSPSERPIIDAVLEHVSPSLREKMHSLPSLNGGQGISIGALKEIVRRSRLMICNDTGPRHFAAAFNIPVITLFGPTDPRWAETYFEKERIIRIDVPCGPCQLKTCPIDHRCMTGITVQMVLAAVRELW
jgi:heptosyltransferase-2